MCFYAEHIFTRNSNITIQMLNILFQIGYLDTFFANNVLAKTFTVCLWILPHEDLTVGVVSTNCKYDADVSEQVCCSE